MTIMHAGYEGKANSCLILNTYAGNELFLEGWILRESYTLSGNVLCLPKFLSK